MQATRLDSGRPRRGDERLSVEAAELSELTDAWYARHPDVVAQEHWRHLDEVRNVPGCERFVRRLLDQGNVHVLVTGSSSKMPSTEIATSLPGRAHATEVLPFGFGEALAHAGQYAPSAWPVGPAVRAPGPRLRRAVPRPSCARPGGADRDPRASAGAPETTRAARKG